MIKESKDLQRENGSTPIVKTEAATPTGGGPEAEAAAAAAVVAAVAAVVKEEAQAEGCLNGVGVDEAEQVVEKPAEPGPSSQQPTPETNSAPVPDSTTPVVPDCPVKVEEAPVTEKLVPTVPIKTELNGSGSSSSSHDFPVTTAPPSGGGSTPTSTDHCEPGLPMSMGLTTTTGPPPNGIQPLPSNVINKQPGSMEAQYMQQQSQIFVFSTNLANKSADAVLQGQYPSIIAFHCAQPGTKKYLEKHPLKMNQFSRQNPAQWLNNLVQMKQKGGPGGLKGSTTPLPDPWLQSTCAGNTVSSTVGNSSVTSGSGMGGANSGSSGNNGASNNNNANNSNATSNNNSVTPTNSSTPIVSTSGICTSNNNTATSSTNTNITNAAPSSCSTSVASNNGNNVMIPPCPSSGPVKDTPCLMGGSPTANPMMHHSPSDVQQPSLTGVKVPDENLTPQQRQHREEQLATLRKMHEMLFPGEHQSLMPDGSMLGQPADSVAMQNLVLMPQKNMGATNHVTPTSAAAQLEWHKLQQQFYEERKKKPVMTGVGSPGGAARAASGPALLRSQGPPPPYHPTTRSASVPTALSSPTPGSPNNPTSNLSLPSPRASSGINSPSDSNSRQQFSTGSARLPGAGPSPTGLHNTPLDSPGPSRPLNPSNPGTPLSTHLSPTAVRKEGTDFTGQQQPVDTMFCRTLQTLAQQKQQQIPTQPPKDSSLISVPSKEPNLMPVPSPQQIQYLNTFEGQELTIQKQPNTSLKESNISSPSLPPPNLDGNLQGSSSDMNTRMSGPATPLTPTSVELRYPSGSGDTRFPLPSPHTPGSDNKAPRRTPGMDGPVKAPRPEDGAHFLSSSPLNDGMGALRFQNPNGPPGSSPSMCSQVPGFVPQQAQPGVGGVKVTSHFLDVSPSGGGPPVDISPTTGGNFPCLRSENVPLNPNVSGSVSCDGKMAHFDPITSMAQMSQQLTSSVSNSPNPQNPVMVGGPGVMGFQQSPAHPGDVGPCQDGGPGGGFVSLQVQGVPPHSYSPSGVSGQGGAVPCSVQHPGTVGSPKSGNMLGLGPPRGPSPYMGNPCPQRAPGRPPAPGTYGHTNVQVKASTPNTIQYLPAKPQTGAPGPRGPPSLDFLQRFANPLSSLDGSVPVHNLQYFPGTGQPNGNGVRMGNVPHSGPGCGNVGGPVVGPSSPVVGVNLPMSGGMVVGHGGPGMGAVPLRGGLRPSGMMRMSGGMLGVGPCPGGEHPFVPGPGPGSQVFVPGPKSSPMGLGGAPDASQPLPPSMGQANNFKNSPFMGPTTADPNYAQQFHNFQQQLYATNTRSQMSNQTLGPNQSFFVPK
ncbi:protein BCL9 homolog [Schistocerca americana]|uniref:protein BCL9 homolog n=1 Tax=Schistocerca americana TaxID=7009 RepID=UPI001F500FEC|nr:protein BCL9 homolog [Schistocerca americana]XP_049953831.1 protein BCL9 homolog isoform X1 [Schistocerca serialis cubense]